MGTELRQLVEQDRDAVRAILAACSTFSEEEVRVAFEMVEAGLAGEYHLLGAVVDGALHGYACAGRAPLTADSWYLYWICVHPHRRGRGTGRELQRYLEESIAGLGGRRIVLETSGRPDYECARGFYRSQGFLHVGTIPNFYKAVDDCLIYYKAVANTGASK